eukprot:1102014-Pleurochrysis_carterae.AAC.1
MVHKTTNTKLSVKGGQVNMPRRLSNLEKTGLKVAGRSSADEGGRVDTRTKLSTRERKRKRNRDRKT